MMFLYRILKPWFMRRYYDELSRKYTHKDMTPVVVDNKGRTYYEFPDSSAVPIVRYAKQKEYYDWLTSGINAATLKDLVEGVQAQLVEALQNSKDKAKFSKSAARALAVMEQIQMRRERIVPIDLIVNTICATLVREDEDPHEWNQAIHQEKCDYFLDHIMTVGFFFHLKDFQRLSNILAITKAGWQQKLRDWLRSDEEIASILETLSSSIESSQDATQTPTS